MNTVVVTGASGLLGRAVCDTLRTDPALDVRGLAFRRRGPGLTPLDLRDAAATERFVGATRPAAIVHAAAERHPDVSETDPAATAALNVEASAVLARAARAAGAWLIYISTDYVFDGTTPPYAPDAPSNPLNVYGRTKRDGERAVLAEHPGACVLRVGILYGQVQHLAESAVTEIAATLQKTPQVTLDAWATRYPLDTADVASVCRQLLAHKVAAPSFGGIHHWSGPEPWTKWGMGRLMASLLGSDPELVRPSHDPPAGAPRPRDCRLDCSTLTGIVTGAEGRLADRLPAVLAPFLTSG